MLLLGVLIEAYHFPSGPWIGPGLSLEMQSSPSGCSCDGPHSVPSGHFLYSLSSIVQSHFCVSIQIWWLPGLQKYLSGLCSGQTHLFVSISQPNRHFILTIVLLVTVHFP